MTFRSNRPAPRRKRRPRAHDERRQQRAVTAGFVGLIAVAVLVLIGSLGIEYYGSHLAAIATVDGVSISKDQWNDQQKVDAYRINATLSSLQSAVAAGTIDQQSASQYQQYLQQQQQSIPQTAATELIDGALQTALAGKMGVVVSDADVEAQIAKEATTPEQRKVLAIVIQPGATPAAASPTPGASAAAGSPGPSAAPGTAAPDGSTPPSAAPTPAASSGPTEAQRAAAKAAADQALAALEAGQPFDQVAKEYSTDPSASNGGDFGYINATDTTDPAWVAALFKLPLNGTTEVIQGADGAYRIGRVTDIVAARTDPNYQQSIQQAGVSLAAYRQAVRDRLVAQKLQDAIVKQATAGDIAQVHAWEIEVATTDAQGTPITAPEVRASHILYSPNGDPSAASSVPTSDPTWAAAKQKAQATADKLRAITDPAQRAAEFAAIAKAESNDTGSGASGGDLGWFTRAAMVPEFATPLFTGTHSTDEIIGPVKTQYGYHVILYVGERPAPSGRIAQIQQELAAPNADFAAIAKADSDAQDASTGGDMGWVAPLQLDQATEKVLFGLTPGQVGSPVTTQSGIYLYMVSEKSTRPLDATQITTLQSSAFTNWYTVQKAAATIWESPDIAAATPAPS